MNKLPPRKRTFTEKIAERQFPGKSNGERCLISVETGLPIRDVGTINGFDWRCPVKPSKTGKKSFIHFAL